MRGRGGWGGEGGKQLTLRRWAALMEAALDGHKDTVQLLVQLGADVNAMNNDGETGT